MSSAADLSRAAAQRLRAAGVGSPEADAEQLLAWVLATTRAGLMTRDVIDPDAIHRYEAAVRRRAAREPLQHILGTAAFRHVEVAIGPGVFVPRPETELLVDAVLPRLRECEHPVLVDLCSGSGALALAVQDELPAARVTAVERSERALLWLRRNTAGTGLSVVAGDVGDPGVLAGLNRTVDAVVANPPYVPDGTHVEQEVRADPHEAVFAGPDGLTVIAHVIARAAELLRPGGVLAVEHDDSHGETVPEMLRRDGRWRAVTEHPDLTGRPRFATALRV